MYNVFIFILLVCGSVRLEELECPVQVENLTMTRVSPNTLTATWERFSLSDCGQFIITLSQWNDNYVEMRFIRYLYTVTFTDLDPCSDYFIDVSPLAEDATFKFTKNLVVIQSDMNFSQLFIFRFGKGTVVYDSDKTEIAKDSSDNSKCYPAAVNRNATDVTETEISEPTGITSTTPFMIQSTTETNQQTTTTTSAGTTEITMETENIVATTLEEMRTDRPTADGFRSCTNEDIPTEVESLKVELTSENSVNVSWLHQPCALGLYILNLSHDSRYNVSELRLMFKSNFAQLLDLEECHTYTISVTPMRGGLLLSLTKLSFLLGSRISWITAVKITTAEKSNVTVTNLMVSKTTRSSIAVSWTAPPHRVCYDKDNRFYVEIQPYGSESADVNKGKVRSTSWNQLKLTDLEPCAAYRVSVTVGFVGGFKSTEASSIVAMTLPDKISNLTAVNVTSTSLVVSWRAPTFWDCGVQKDRYFVRLESSTAPKLWHVDTNSILLSDLEPCTNHEISVSLVVVGEVDPSLRAFITVHTLSDSLSECISATFSGNKATIVVALPVCIILVALIAFVVLLRYRGLIIGRTRWEITGNWNVVREAIGNQENHSVTSTVA